MLQTEFFDAASATSRGESFDYDAYLEDMARSPAGHGMAAGAAAGTAAGAAAAVAARRQPLEGQTVNPLYGQGTS